MLVSFLTRLTFQSSLGCGWVLLCNLLDSSSEHCELRAGPTRYPHGGTDLIDRSTSDFVPFFTPAEVGGLLIFTHSVSLPVS
jgi:hypothetical protein